MPRNIEIKAYVENFNSMLEKVTKLAGQEPKVINQDDNFFNCSTGRLKLRKFSDNKGELIFYQRPSSDGPKECFYVISPTQSPDTLAESLILAYGVIGRVTKKRLLFITGRTRIHLDKVEGLGDFIELEVVLNQQECSENGIKEANDLMRILGIESSSLIQDAYVDMIDKKL